MMERKQDSTQKPGSTQCRAFDAKAQYGELFKITVGSTTILFRPLTLRELQAVSDLTQSLEPEAIDGIVIALCVVEPEIETADDLVQKLPEAGPGILTGIAEKILRVSRPTGEEEATQWLDRARTTIVEDDVWEIVSAICRAFPSYNPDTLMDHSVRDIFFRLALSEKVMDALTSGSQVPQEMPLSIDHTLPINMQRNQVVEAATAALAQALAVGRRDRDRKRPIEIVKQE